MEPMQPKSRTVQEVVLSEGEQFIQEYFLDENIEFEAQKKLYLKGDSKSYRVVDFYLPKLDVYVEFLGRWNQNEEEKNRYREKRRVYQANRVPCVFLYPENLGIIEHVFPLRLRQVLKQHGMRKQLLRYLTHDFHHHNIGILLFFGLFTLSIVVHFTKGGSFEDYLINTWVMGAFVIGWYYAYSYIEYRKSKKAHSQDPT